MEEKKYSIDEILAEARRRAPADSSKSVSAQADDKARKIVQSIKEDSANAKETDFDALLKELTAHRPKREHRAHEKPVAAPQVQAPAPSTLKTPAAAVPVQKEIQIAPQASDIPQSPRRHRSIDEVMQDIAPRQGNKIESAISNQKEEKERAQDKQLTRTGVIRKADALIEDAPAPKAADNAPAPIGAAVSGNLQRKEKIVGDKEDIQTKAYNEYIRNKEKKKQDTGMIKTIDIKLDDRTKQMPALKQTAREEQKTKIHPSFAVIDNPTDVEKTIVDARPERVISSVYHTGNIEGQTRLEGFFDENEYEKISEDELEEQLVHNRRQKIDDFEFEKEFKEKNREAVETSSAHSIDDTYAPEKETPVINDVIDYNSKNDQRAIYIELEQLLNRFKLRTVITFGALLGTALIGLLGSGILSDFGLGTANERIYIILNTALLLLMMIVHARAIVKGIKALFMLKPSGDSLMAFASIITLVHCILSFTFGENGTGVSHIYVGAMGFVFLLNCFGKRSMIRRVFKNFRFLIKKGEKYSCACITDEKEVREFVKGEDVEYCDVRYNAKTEFATRFLANSYADDPSDTVAKLLVYPVIGLALIIGVVCYLIYGDLMASISALTAIMLIGVPASSLMAFNKALENADAALLKERGTITGFAAVDDAAETTAVVLDSADLFPANTAALKGMKLFKKMQMDEAILYAASVLNATTHPLKDIFLESVSEVMDHMPESYDTAYEAKLGLSAWIYDRKVLLGNKEMMGAHGIEIPATAHPEEYSQANRRAMFLAIDGAVYAMFVVEYFSDPEIEYELQRLEASDIEILIKTEDSNIDAALISEVFDLEKTSVKILGMIAGNLYDEKTEQPVFNEAKIINRGDPVTFMRSLTACSILSGQFRLLKTLQYVCVALGVVVLSIISCIGSIASIGPLHIVIYGAFWMIVTNLIPRIYKAVPKR